MSLRLHRLITILLVALFAGMAIAMVATCQVGPMSMDDAASTTCHHDTTASVMPFACCLMAVLPAEIEQPLGLSFVALIVIPLVLKRIPPSFPFFIPPRTMVS
jgi:hypothetical protein